MKLLVVCCLGLAAGLVHATTLAVVDERSATSTFDQLWSALSDDGHDVVVSNPQEAAAKLRHEGDRFQHLVVFSPSVKDLPAELAPQALARRLQGGTNLVLVAPADAPELWRDFAREFEVDLGDRGQHVVDHLAFDKLGDDGSHSLLSLAPANSPSPFVSAATRRGPNVLYRGAGHTVGRHPLLTPILRAGPTAFLADASSSAASSDARSAGSSLALVSAFQARNNARALFIGSADLFSDELLARPGSGNLAFALDILSWAFQKTGQLRLADLSHRAVGHVDGAPSYRTGTELKVEVAVSATPAYDEDDLQFEFGMLDPHVRLPLVPASAPRVAGASNTTRFEAAFVIPDRHGVFTLRVDHRRPGWTSMLQTQAVPVTPPRHDEYERFLAGALPWYGGAASVSALFLVFVAVWTSQS
ncbi:hypothetical protein JCM3775_007527 [Rhodotorula graminis]|uniref:Dolichyl-diphosphooligosaccharide--protein glycosyltransferase subunit WBP1 n=1 Tax=Rhodotorula graminis (strain WP1) TaxID=578459 RepID=A0A0P9GWR3_RHOGW|nr:uncharacterized protein RHOBADRAFT_56250 [Rhodotorula graminis WP1]KPV71862.1 hypothetical protein RHOBADRAFT_56250 [Rhodotorula graminis WP1]